jgi:hypothetical protein
MTFRLGVLIGLACGFALASIWCKRRTVHPAQPVSPTVEDLKWDKRIDELGSFYAEEKAADNLRSKR